MFQYHSLGDKKIVVLTNLQHSGLDIHRKKKKTLIFFIYYRLAKPMRKKDENQITEWKFVEMVV